MSSTATESKLLLSTREAGDRLGVTPFTVRRLVHAGALACIRFTETSRMRFRPSDVEALAASVEENS